jgi:hypothetical protein
MCWSLERWGEIETLRQSRLEADRAAGEEVKRLLATAIADATEPAENRVPAVAGRATSGTGA